METLNLANGLRAQCSKFRPRQAQPQAACFRPVADDAAPALRHCAPALERSRRKKMIVQRFRVDAP